MPLEASIRSLTREGGLADLPDAWRRPLLALSVSWAALIVLFITDWAAMALQWWDSSTYNHILLVPPIFAALMWQRRGALGQLEPTAWWPGLILFAGSLFLWLLGAFSELNLVRHLGAVTMLIATFLALLGPRVAAASLFPLSYLLFLVPFGDELVPTLQMITADLTIALTHLSAIPAQIDGVFIDTPAGLFEVAEACSGVKFLVAMIALGTLVAATCFQSWTRRLIFMVAAILLPIVANGVRAWGTIYIAQSQGIEFAAGFDHIFYGWVFFALVMALLLGLSWRWFDRSPEDDPVDVTKIQSNLLLSKLARFEAPRFAVIGAGAAMLLAASLWASYASAQQAELPRQIALPEVAGWTRVDYAPQVDWQPQAAGADHKLLGRYRSESGKEVDVLLAVYSAQGEGREAGGFGQGALVPDTPWRWLETGPEFAGAKSDYILANGRVKRFAATWYRSGDLLSGSNTRLKLQVMRDKLLLDSNPTSMLILSAEAIDGVDPGEAVAEFAKDAGPLNEWIDRAVQSD